MLASSSGATSSRRSPVSAAGQQVSDHVAQLLLLSGDLLVSMEEGHEFGVVVPVGLVGDEREGLEHSFESLASVARGHGAVGVQASGA